MTQKALAEKAQISVRKLQDIENHNVDTKLSILTSLCDALGIPFRSLISTEFSDAKDFARIHSPSLDHVATPVEVICKCGEVIYSNPKALKLRGAHSFDLIKGSKVWDHHPKRERPRIQEFLTEISHHPKEPFPFFGSLIRSDGKEIISLRVEWDYIRNADGDIVGYLTLLSS